MPVTKQDVEQERSQRIRSEWRGSTVTIDPCPIWYTAYCSRRLRLAGLLRTKLLNTALLRMSHNPCYSFATYINSSEMKVIDMCIDFFSRSTVLIQYQQRFFLTTPIKKVLLLRPTKGLSNWIHFWKHYWIAITYPSQDHGLVSGCVCFLPKCAFFGDELHALN